MIRVWINNYNYSTKSYRFLLFLAILTVHAEPSLDLSIPSIGESSGQYLSPEEERRVGDAFMRSLRRSLVFVEDPIITDYLQTIGNQVASNSDAPGQSFDFFVVNDPSINAFAGPGGHIAVNSGLILTTESESELAAVIAHEAAHVTQHHIARSVEMGERMTLPTIAALLAAVVIASQSGQSGEAGQAAIATAIAGSTQVQIDFLRGNEQEADRVGTQTLQRAGFDPRAMAGFFERMQKGARYSVGAPEFLRDHPVTEARIADAYNHAEHFPYRQRQDSLGYYIARARLKVQTMRSPAEGVRELSRALETGRYRSVVETRYARVLALLGAHDLESARSEITHLLADDPDRIAYSITRAEIEQEAGNQTAALNLYRQIQRLYPNHPAVTTFEVEALLQTDHAREARDLLKSFMRNRPPNPMLYKLLARAEGESGSEPASREAVAEYLYLSEETRTAIHELQKAQALPNLDFYTGSRIDARIKELEEELAMEKERAKNGTAPP